jgi:hypothetical protein
MSSLLSSHAPCTCRPKPPGGLFEATLCALLIYAVYAQTPLGALGEFLVRTALGQEYTPSWFATFRGKEIQFESGDKRQFSEGWPAVEVPPAVQTAAQDGGVSSDILFALVGAHGQCQGASCTIAPPHHLDEILGRYDFGEQIDIRIAASGLRAVQDSHSIFQDSVSSMVTALYIGVTPTRQAVQQAFHSGLEKPEDIESFTPFLPPGLRRGPLQDAVQVLALYRLRRLSWPVDKHFIISSPFGMRRHPVLRKNSFHNGVDVATPVGTPLRAPHGGRIARVGFDSASGKYVRIDHGLGIETAYAHLDALQVKTGDRVIKKQVFGLTGKSGRVTGPHLHYVLRVAGKPSDPLPFGGRPVNPAQKTGELLVP